MRTVSQRELRNDAASVMRQVTEGASFRVTNRGRPIAALVPLDARSDDEFTLRDGTGVMEFEPGVVVPEPTAQALAELRGDR